MASNYLAPKRIVRAILDSQPTSQFYRSVSSTCKLNSKQPVHTSSSSDPSLAPLKYTKPDSKWLSTTKQRIGKCMLFGLQPGQTRVAGDVLKQLARDWRELVAGSEGFLTGKDRQGLFRHNVVWGEMVWRLTPLSNYGDCG